jgi:hypothetical protein
MYTPRALAKNSTNWDRCMDVASVVQLLIADNTGFCLENTGIVLDGGL